jgi:hypothetical protein
VECAPSWIAVGGWLLFLRFFFWREAAAHELCMGGLLGFMIWIWMVMDMKRILWAFLLYTYM